MHYDERYQLHIARRGEEAIVEDLFDMSEEEAVETWGRARHVQGAGSQVTLVRAMTVTIASSIK